MKKFTLRDKVEDILKRDEESRNSDVRLTGLLWIKYYQQHIHRDGENKRYIYLESLYDLPSQDNIKRHRAVFQNVLWKYLPTRIEVVRARKMNEDKWRQELGYAIKNKL